MSGTTARSKCRNCKAVREHHLVDTDSTRMPRCPGGAGTRFAHYRANGRKSMSYSLDEIAVLAIIVGEAHRYGTVRASNPALRKLQEKFAKMADPRTVRKVKADRHCR